MISVLVPVYNANEYLEKCIASVMNQTYQDFELILVNDGSTDDSDFICQKWLSKDKRIRYFKKSNEGIGLTRNFAIKMASQPYITFLDADDWWDENYLLEMLCPVKEQNADVVICDMYYVTNDQHGELIYAESNVRLPEKQTLNATWSKNIIHRVRTFSWGKIFLKSLFTEHYMFSQLCAFEDIPIVSLIAALAQKIYRVPKPLYYYNRFHQNNLTNNNNYYDNIIQSLQKTKEHFVNEGIFSVYKYELMRLAYSQIRFVLKKAMDNSYATVNDLKNDLFHCWNNLFPNICILDNYTYGVFGDDALASALSNLLIHKENILWVQNDTLNESSLDIDFIIADSKYQDMVKLETTNKRILWIDLSAFEYCGESSKYWEISDFIFNYLVQSKKGY